MATLKAQVMVFLKKSDRDLYSLRLLTVDIQVPLYLWLEMLRYEHFDKSAGTPILFFGVFFFIELLEQQSRVHK